MIYRTIEVAWQPKSQKEWRTFTLARREAARLWADLVERHHQLRRLRWKWPTVQRWQKWAKGRYPHLHSQSVQQIINDFCEAVASASSLRRNGYTKARYPWHKPKYRQVIYTNQAAVIRGKHLILPNGKAGRFRIRIPDSIMLPGRLKEARLHFGRVELVCECEEPVLPPGPVVGVDLGVNTLIAATDGQKAILISGREAKSAVQWRNKRLASLQSKQSEHRRGSRRWKRLQRRKHKLLNKARNRIKDLTHKATRKVADAFPGARCYVGKPFNDASRKMRRIQAQQVSQACNSKLTQQLDYKTNGAIQVDEPYSSQFCPVCGQLNRCGRVYRCRGCGFTAPRDLVGGTNIRSLGMCGSLRTGCDVPDVVVWKHPIKYPGSRQVVPNGCSAGSPVSANPAWGSPSP
jgi:putative transposase